MLIALAILLAIAVIYVIAVYNGLNTLLVRIKASVQEIGNQLKRQAGLIPNLENTVKGYASHEKEIYQQITAARKTVVETKADDLATVEKLENNLQQLNSGMKVLLENNPELKANENFSKLMAELADTADKIMYSRRTLINLTAQYNQKLVTFPSNVIAGWFNFKEQKGLETPTTGEHVEVSEAETKTPEIKF